MAAGVAVLGLLALVAYGLRNSRAGLVAIADAQPIQSLAVLPFTSFSDDPEQDHFADGMTDALIGQLHKLGVRATNRTSVMAYKD